MKWGSSWESSREVGWFVAVLPRSGVVRGRPPMKWGSSGESSHEVG